MCGICGITTLANLKAVPEQDILAMSSLLRHRGPDGRSFYLDPLGTTGLGHTRLSIVDPAGGAQPLTNEDSSVWLSFNGEIFNYIELRSILAAAGHVFRTHSDSEVIVHAYEQYGDDFVQHLNGQFAIALWDCRRRRLLLIRDRLGILPLFYTRQKDRLLFASEIKALLPLLPEAPRIAPAALEEVFTFWSPLSPHTLFKDVLEVRPGWMIIIEHGRLSEKNYWNWQFPENDSSYLQGSVAELAEQLYDVLADATRIRLRADVPVGAYLSGGIDSSTLVALIRRHSEAPLKTFSIGFEDESLDETPFQQMMVDHLGVDHHRVFCHNAEIATDFPTTIFHAETAVMRTAPTPMRLLSGLVRASGYKVVLTGEGADEVLGGYDIFKENKVRQFWARQPQSNVRPLLLKKLYPYLKSSGAEAQKYLNNFYGISLENPRAPGFSHLPRWFNTAQCKIFFSNDLQAVLQNDAVERFTTMLPPAFPRWHAFNQAQYIEVKTLMGSYLLSSQGDRMLMSNSVEGRFPFLDHRLIEFANLLPPRLKMHGLMEKYLLKHAMKKHLPEAILRRHKQPYRAPNIPAFFSSTAPAWAEDLAGEKKIKEYGYFDHKRVGFLLNKIRSGLCMSNKDNMALVGILSTQLCHYHFIERFSQFSKNTKNSGESYHEYLNPAVSSYKSSEVHS